MNLCIHYGFGDYVVCYGMIKELAKNHQHINLFVRNHRSTLHIENIIRLFSSIHNVTVTLDKPEWYKDTVYVGYEEFNKALNENPNIQAQEYFYNKVGLPLNLLWDNWYFKRDSKKEKEAYYDKIGLKDGEVYIVLHDDPERSFAIREGHIDRSVRVIHLMDYQDVSILDTLYLIEKCRELHTFNTGLVPFVDQMKIQHDSLNYHKYLKPLFFEQPLFKMKWNIIN